MAKRPAKVSCPEGGEGKLSGRGRSKRKGLLHLTLLALTIGAPA